MLKIDIPDIEIFDELKSEFISIPSITLCLEHSLISLSKWEQKWHKPFLSKLEKHAKTNEEVIDYIRCMSLNQNVDPDIFNHLPVDAIEKINAYIDDPMTATWFSDDKEKKTSNNREIVTSELIYYWMIKLNIPVEFQKWHLNRLMTLIEIFSVKDAPPKKLSASEMAKRRTALNAQRLKQYNTRG